MESRQLRQKQLTTLRPNAHAIDVHQWLLTASPRAEERPACCFLWSNKRIDHGDALDGACVEQGMKGPATVVFLCTPLLKEPLQVMGLWRALGLRGKQREVGSKIRRVDTKLLGSCAELTECLCLGLDPRLERI